MLSRFLHTQVVSYRIITLAAFLSLLLITSTAASAQAGLPYNVVPRDEVQGARVVPSPWQVPLQSSIINVSPDPAQAFSDTPQTTRDKCMALGEVVIHPPCVYGNPTSKKEVVLFGDSRVQQFFPALELIALQKNWKLTVLVRANCFPALVERHEYFCDKWRSNTMRRIVQEEKPDLTILGTATKGSYTVTVGGEELSREESQPYLVRGMVKTINKLRKAGSKILVLRDQSLAPFKPSECASVYYYDLKQCAFTPRNRAPRAFELDAARITKARTIDPQSMFCSKTICPAVIGNVAVHRDIYHITDTYAETMKPWLQQHLRKFSIK